jgi:hypothetical protein
MSVCGAVIPIYECVSISEGRTEFGLRELQDHLTALLASRLGLG